MVSSRTGAKRVVLMALWFCWKAQLWIHNRASCRQSVTAERRGQLKLYNSQKSIVLSPRGLSNFDKRSLVFFVKKNLWNIIDIQYNKQHLFNVYNLTNFDMFTYLWNHSTMKLINIDITPKYFLMLLYNTPWPHLLFFLPSLSNHSPAFCSYRFVWIF